MALGNFLLSIKKHPRICIKFSVRNKLKCSYTIKMAVTLGKSTVSKQKFSVIQRFHKRRLHTEALENTVIVIVL